MGDDGMLCVTSSSHIPNLGLLALGRSDGTIVLVRALDVLFRHLLRDAAKHQQGTCHTNRTLLKYLIRTNTVKQSLD